MSVTMFTREGEVFLRVIHEEAGRCSVAGCWKPLAEGRFAWDYTNDPEAQAQWSYHHYGQPWSLGEEFFHCVRHADGTYHTEKVYDHRTRGEVTRPRSSEFSLPRCPQCKAWCSLVTKLLAYGDEATCLNCSWSRYFDIGD